MKRTPLLMFTYLLTLKFVLAQGINPIAEYRSEIKNVELSNFDINDTILYIPTGYGGLSVLNISDIDNVHEVFKYTEYEKRSGKKVYGKANCVKVIDDTIYLSYGDLGLKVLNAGDPTMLYVMGTYYRYQHVYCAEIYENFALLGYTGMGLEVINLSDLDDIKMVSRNNIKDFSVNNIQVSPPYVIISDDTKGLRIFKFLEPFTAFKQSEFPKSHLTDNKTHKFLISGSTGYLANDSRGLSVLNMDLPQYPHEVNVITSSSRLENMMIDGNYLFLVCGNYIEIYNIKELGKPEKCAEYIDKHKEFVSLKMHDDKLFVSYSGSKNNYGIVIFQVE